MQRTLRSLRLALFSVWQRPLLPAHGRAAPVGSWEPHWVSHSSCKSEFGTSAYTPTTIWRKLVAVSFSNQLRLLTRPRAHPPLRRAIWLCSISVGFPCPL